MPYVEILIVAALILLNGALAMAELAIASARPPKLWALAGQGVAARNRAWQDLLGAPAALALAADPGRFLATVQFGITLIGILAGAFSGAALGGRLAQWLQGFGIAARWAEPLGFGLVIGIITYFSLIVGELVPKQLALRNPERIACLMAPAMTMLATAAAPIVWLFDRSGRLVLALLGKSAVADETVTDAEIHALIAEAETAGVLEPEERRMIVGVMRLGDRLVRSVMTQRQAVEMIDINETAAKIGKRFAESGHSRFVAHDGDPENILGVLQAKDVAAALLRRKSPNLKALVRQAPVIPDTLDALDVVQRLQESEVHFGLVYDEYGHFEGIVTTADILQAIIGAFTSEAAGEDGPDIVEREDGSLLVSGSAAIDAVSARLGLKIPEQRGYRTVAGFVLENMGRIPKAGENFDAQGFRFETVDLDGKRIDKLIVTRNAAATRRAMKL